MDDECNVIVKLVSPTVDEPVWIDGDSDIDLQAAHDALLPPLRVTRVGLGIAMDIPAGWGGKMESRSGLACRNVISVGGVIDESYTGELNALLLNLGPVSIQLRAGERVVQMRMRRTPRVRITVTAEPLRAKPRGERGFGSTGIAGPRRAACGVYCDLDKWEHADSCEWAGKERGGHGV